jgi:tetratricopeptide (TPR) repeat protein
MRKLRLLLVGAAALLALGARPGGPGRQALERDVRAALAAWAAGDQPAALAGLRRADEAAAAPRASELLHTVKLGVARSLRRQPGAVHAFVRLEERAYSAYAAELRPALAGAVRRLVPALIQETLGKRPSRDERETAAALLTSFAGALHTAGQERGAGELYLHALLLAPAEPAALTGLAAVHEKRGEYAAAMERLRQVVALDGTDREMRLRLAITRLRLGIGGGADEAERELRALAAAGDDWVRSLAVQELARRLLRRGEAAAAMGFLESAATDLPCDPSLQVQAAYAAERAGGVRPLDLGTLAQCGEAGQSARARYARPPGRALSRLRHDLAARDREWRDALRHALGRRPR